MKFKSKLFSLSFLPIVILLHSTSAIDFDEGCFLDGNTNSTGGNSSVKPQLQLAFVVDQTYSFHTAKLIFAELLMKSLDLLLKTLYTKTEYALTLFADWPASAEPDIGPELSIEIPIGPIGPIGPKPKPHNNAEACYHRSQTFTEDYVVVERLMLANKALHNGGKENSLAAMAMTITDKGILWKPKTGPGKLRKVVFLLTDRTYGNISKPGDRVDFKGDGTDTCSTSKPPPLGQIGKILAENKVAVIALIPPSAAGENAYQWYVDHIGQLPSVPFCGKDFDLKKNLNVLKIIDFIKGCFLGFGDGDGGDGGEGGGGGSKGDQCIFGDPPGFNTLGF